MGKSVDPRLVEYATPRQREIIEAVNRHGGIKPAARALGIRKQSVQDALRRVRSVAAKNGFTEDKEKPLYDGRVDPFNRLSVPTPRRGTVKRFLLTSAQNNTPVHGQLWANMLAYAEDIGAHIFVSTYTYNHNAYGQLATKRGTRKTQGDLWYDDKILPFIKDDSIEIAPGLVWCGEMNILPTAVRPLSGLETYTGRKSGIFPAAKLSMRSVASVKTEPTKFNFTTGTVTQRNYIQKKAGQKAEFHHCYGFLIVEVDWRGDWWVRQVVSDRDGNFYDCDVEVRKQSVIIGEHRVEAIVWGDTHAEVVDPEVAEVCWGKGGMLDTLQPRHQMLHDLLDFRRRNHHDRRDPHLTFQKHIEGREHVETEIQITADLVTDMIWRNWLNTVVVCSNHDNAFLRWLREEDYRNDPVNARYFLENQLRVYEAIEQGDVDFHLVEWALRRKGIPQDVRFLRQDEPYLILPGIGGGIECGMHGDISPNGARGTPQGLMRMGRRAITGHTHSAGIYDGLWVAGLTARLEQGYNIGPGSWSHSQVVVQPNGKRQMITIWNNKWRA